MATVNNRPFPCWDNAFIDSVLDDHKKSQVEHNSMVMAHSGSHDPAPFVFTYAQHTIPTDCNAYYVKITFDPNTISNSDIKVSFPPWPDSAGNPVSISGEVYYSLVFFNGLRTRKNVAHLELRKAVEYTDDGTYVTVVVKGFDLGNILVYHGNITSQFPIEKGGQANQASLKDSIITCMKNASNTADRNFDLEDADFLAEVLMNHEISATFYNQKVQTVFSTLNVLPYSPAFVVDPTAIHADQPSTWLLQVRYNANPNLGNTNFDIEWVEWPLTAGEPQPVSGCVHYSVPLLYALHHDLGAISLKFTKAHEYLLASHTDITAIAFKAYDIDGNLVYIGNITSELPFPGFLP